MATQWFWTRSDGEKRGPVTAQELKDLALTGQLLPADWVNKGETARAVKASRVKGLFASPGRTDPPPP